MADSRLLPVNPLDTLKVPDDVKIRLAELELELSEGKHILVHSFSLRVQPRASATAVCVAFKMCVAIGLLSKSFGMCGLLLMLIGVCTA